MIDSSFIHNLETISLSLDTEKAFHRVNWKFLFTVHWKFGIGNSIDRIRIFYSSPSASVTTHYQILSNFNLHTSRVPSIPFSLCNLYRTFSRVHLTKQKYRTLNKNLIYKISLHADNVLLFLQNSQASLSRAVALQ